MSRHQYSLFEHHVHQGVVCIRDQLFFVDQLWVFEDKRCNCLTDRSKHYTTTHLLWWICTCCTQCFNSIVTCSSTGLSASVSCDCCITCCIASTDLLGSLCSISEQCTLQSCNASIIGLLLLQVLVVLDCARGFDHMGLTRCSISMESASTVDTWLHAWLPSFFGIRCVGFDFPV